MLSLGAISRGAPMTACNYCRFSLTLLAAASLIAPAAEVQRMEAVESTADENMLPAGTRLVPGRDKPGQ